MQRSVLSALSRFGGRAVTATSSPALFRTATPALAVPASHNFQAVRHANSYDYQPSYDAFGKSRDAAGGDDSKRAFAYAVMGGTRFMYASAARVLALKFIMSMTASADVLALSTLEVDISPIQPGNSITVKWRGTPVFIRHRTDAEIELAANVNQSELKDPQEDKLRHAPEKPEWLVLLGVCTHLGCVPLGDSGDYKGWFCPCHGSHYDTSGRIRKGPAPLNLGIPEYKFIEENVLLIG